MWDPKKKFFFSLDRDSDRPIDVRSIQGFLTLCCGAATKKQAKLLVAELTDTTMWWCKYPVPTVALNDPKFDSKGFWRGDMWPVTTYLVAYGLNRYGYHNEARKLTEKMVELFARNGINERYNGVTGKPLGVQGLGMSCSVWSMIVENYYGITNDYQTICVPPNAKGRHLKLGQLEVNYVRDDQVEVSTGFDRKIKVVFPGTHKKLRVTLNSGDAELPVAIISSSSASVEFKAESNKKYLIQTI
jgi:hypothetical protein